MSDPTVRVERPAPHVVEIVLDRPDVLNAISTTLARELVAAVQQVALDHTVGVVVLASSSLRAFCVGADLKERNALGADDLRAQRPIFRAAFGGVLQLAVPTIAAVDGYALGGGCELALSCDLVVAGADATFGLPEVGLGLIPGGGGTQLLPRRVGLGMATDLILTGRRVGAEEAARIGLASRLVAAGEARSAAGDLAATIAAHSPVSVRAAKRALREGADLALIEGLRVEDRAWHEAAFSPDRAEGIAAFTEKRPPRWPSWGE